MQADMRPLEFDGIRRILEQLCATPYGAEAARNLTPAPDLGVARQMQAAVTAARKSIDAGVGGRIPDLPDIRAALRQAESSGSALSGAAFVKLRTVLVAGQELHPHIAKDPGRYPGDAGDLIAAQAFFDRMAQSLTASGAVREDATPELAKLHGELKEKRGDVLALLHKMLAQGALASQSKDSVDWRSQRAVLKLPTQLADKVRGVRRGAAPGGGRSSAGGSAQLVEPMEAVPLNNRLEALGGQIDGENHQVLRRVTDDLRRHLPAMHKLVDALTWLDLSWAGGQLSAQLNASAPDLVDAPVVELAGAYHPQLLLAFAQGHGAMPVPLDFRIDQDQPILVITGPNTGGKTVVLKTVGLLAVMAFCGLHLPTDGHARIGDFRNVIVDVGDPQNLANHLSTFAGHVEVLKRLLSEANGHTLVLLDELGTGTDPEEGAALAMSVLDVLAERGVRGVVTTHLSPLKGFAAEHPRLTNASMRFDLDALKPEYVLQVGVPGRSLALVVAHQRGLDPALLERAHRYLREIAPNHECSYGAVSKVGQ